MLSYFHRIRKDEEGQSLVIACVSILALALCVMATINLGRVVHNRIGMQNTVDAAAYSVAAVEARAFNFYAFSNRTQIVHYLSCMVWQTYLSILTFVQYLMTELLAFVETLDQCKTGDWCIKALCKILVAIPIIGEVIEAIVEAIDAAKQALQAVVQVVDGILQAVDALIGLIAIPAFEALNIAMFGINELMRAAVLPQVSDGAKSVVKANDDQIGSPGLGWLAALTTLNETNFNGAHNSHTEALAVGSTNARLDDPKSDSAKSKVTMGELVNATRYNNMLTDRSINAILPGSLSFIAKIVNKLIHKYGQTKLVAEPIRDSGRNNIHANGFPNAQISQGNSLGADDLFYLGFSSPVPDIFGFGEKEVKDWPDPNTSIVQKPSKAVKVSVWAERDFGRHYKVAPNQNGADSDGIKNKKFCLVPPGPDGWWCVCGIKIFYANVQADNQDRNHPWLGITGFMSFDPGDTNQNSHKGFFHQPSTLVYRTKTYDQITKNHAGDVDRIQSTEIGKGGGIEVGTPTNAVKVSTTSDNIAMPSLLQSGSINTLTRSLTYYHRPHNWEEPPNFFNPYWRAKLDPVVHESDSIPILNSLPLDSLPLDELIVH